MMKILVLNSGSSSIKYSLFDMTGPQVLVSGVFERIGEPRGKHSFKLPGSGGQLHKSEQEQPIPDHRQGLEAMIRVMQESGVLKAAAELSAIGHRVVHGGEMFHEPTLIDAEVLAGISKMIPLAPLHNPANLMGIEVALEFAEGIPQVAVFDTAFHQSIPDYAFHYALPKKLYEQHGIRRYGFHGTSHFYVARQAAGYLRKPLESLNLVTLHLGNGGSVSAIEKGKCVDTSMGMTPLEGLVMGTRSGDIDPAIPYFLSSNLSMNSQQIDELLNRQSGLKGLCGENDMRAVHRLAESGNQDARLALEVFCYRIKKYIGAYIAVLGSIDALVFTGGIGENDAWVRETCCAGLEPLGIAIDREKNGQRCNSTIEIGKSALPVGILVIPTNEELEIANQTLQRIQSTRQIFVKRYQKNHNQGHA